MDPRVKPAGNGSQLEAPAVERRDGRGIIPARNGLR